MPKTDENMKISENQVVLLHPASNKKINLN